MKPLVSDSPIQSIRKKLQKILTQRARTVFRHIVLMALGIAMIYPLLWMVGASLKGESDIFGNVSLFTSNPHWSNYSDGWNAQPYTFGHYMINSMIISIGAIVGNLLSCSMAAYGFSRLEWRGRGAAFGFMLMTLMVPTFVLVVPQYIMWSKLGLVNTFVPLILPSFLATQPFFIFLMVQFFRGIPKSLDEAAMIDGAGPFTVFFKVLLPNVLPALATTSIFTFIWTWNDFFNQLIYLTKPQNLTAAVALRNFADATSGTSWGPMFAMSTISLIPVFAVFLFGQRYLVEGVATTGLK